MSSADLHLVETAFGFTFKSYRPDESLQEDKVQFRF